MDLREAIFLCEVGIPHSQVLVYVKLSGQIAVDPTVGKVHEVNLKLIEVRQDLGILLLDDGFHFL